MHDAYLTPVHRHVSDRFDTRFFLVQGRLIEPGRMVSVPFEGYADWLSPRFLVEPSCRFSDIQREVFSKLNLLYDSRE